MYGHDGAPPSRSTGTVITLRVLFAAAALLTCGLFACAPLFRVALQRGRWFDWVAAWVSLPVSVAALVIVGTVPENDRRGDIALAVALILGVGSVAYHLVHDIRLHEAGRRSAGHAPPHAQTAPGSYGSPHPVPPAAPYPGVLAPQHQHPQHPQPQHPQAQQPPHPQPQPPVPQAYLPGAPVPRPPSQRVAPAGRIDQVRAELDELSDYLRQHGDRHDGDREGGR
ncbi:hypothetical protein [Streptomyces aureus]|uniref:hypothetical protein n=1 Tax=Streptomyces aureus TaxID=193461 RepID=UPI000559DC0F|nr:hypothetical protein [Streptomyces aureus]